MKAPSAFARRISTPGSTGGLTSLPSTTLNCPSNLTASSNFGLPVASAGDVNGDGYADVIIGADSAGQAYLYLGGASDLSTTPQTITGPDAGSDFGYSVASAGDVNGDGYADVIISATGFNQTVGRAYLFLGGPGGLAASPAASITGPDGANGYFGSSVAGAGDVNGDGYADVIVGAPNLSNQTGRAYLYLGSATGLASTATETFDGPDGVGCYYSVWLPSAGDVNGDGYADIVVGAPRPTATLGRPTSTPGTAPASPRPPAATLTVGDETGGFGTSIASAGDVDGDGFGDVVVGAPFAGNGGVAYFYLGGSGGVDDGHHNHQ